MVTTTDSTSPSSEKMGVALIRVVTLRRSGACRTISSARTVSPVPSALARGNSSRETSLPSNRREVSTSSSCSVEPPGAHRSLTILLASRLTDVTPPYYTPFQTKPDAPPARLIVRRVKPTPGSQLALFARYSYHAFITDRDGETLVLEADHRRHAEIENAIRDLKYGVGLNHLPSGRFAANGAWLAVQVMAHNLARWTARIGLGERSVITKTLRRRVFALVGRITRSARRLSLHLPRRWPWETQFSRALARLQAIPLPA